MTDQTQTYAMPPHEPQRLLFTGGTDVPVQVLDESLFTGIHDWRLIPVSGLKFRDTVEQYASPSHDLAQYKSIAGKMGPSQEICCPCKVVGLHLLQWKIGVFFGYKLDLI